jgi:RNA polymerase sigma-70 factor (ECF subfamily)
MEPDSVAPIDPPGPDVGRAVEQLVLTLPPKERTCVLLKDVFDYSLEEIAALVGSTVGGVKAALSRGRSKLAASPAPPRSSRLASAEMMRLLHLYVERFNERDWDGVRELIAADATLHVADRFAGRLADSPYFGNYERWTVAWRLAMGEVDGEPTIIILQGDRGRWTATAPVRLDIAGGRITRIADYVHCPWILPAATLVLVSDGNAS